MVGVGMRSHVGIASKMFRTLAEEGINIQMISTSEIKISVVIDEKYLELAVRAAAQGVRSGSGRGGVKTFRILRNRFDEVHSSRKMRGLRRDGRVVEGTPLLREHTGKKLYRGFESLSLRQDNYLIARISSLPQSHSVAKSWTNARFNLSRSRDLSAPSIHFEYTRNSISALARPICLAIRVGFAPAINARVAKVCRV